LIYKRILKKKGIVLFLLTPPSPAGEGLRAFSTLNDDIALNKE